MTEAGRPSRTAISKPRRYSSRSVRPSTTLSEEKRLYSWLLQAKCFRQAPAPSDCTPRMKAAASLPVSSGSSEKYSKFRPQSGLRLRFAPGPRMRPTPSASASRPRAAPISKSSSSSQPQAVSTAVGKQVAGRERFMPSMSPVCSCLRRPWGPSAIISGCSPSRGTARVCQQSAPSQSSTSSRASSFETSMFGILHICSDPIRRDGVWRLFSPVCS